MHTYVLKRLLLMVPTLLVITFVSYGMMRLAPGDPVKSMGLGSGAMGDQGGGAGEQKEGESENAKVFRKMFNLDKPIVVGYWYWLVGDPERPDSKGILRGDFGVSITVSLSTPVSEVIWEPLWVTIKLNCIVLIFVYGLALPLGILTAIKRDSAFDRITTFFLFLLYSIPSFWVGLLLIIFVAKSFPGWPIAGLDSWKHYVMPVFCMTYGSHAFITRYTRTGLLEVLQLDYVRTARAKGLGEWQVIMKHALRNSLIPLVTIFAGLLPGLIGGSIIIEYLFSIPGMGYTSFDALTRRDYPVLMTLFGLSSTLTLLGILVSDLLYVVVDPRISYDE